MGNKLPTPPLHSTHDENAASDSSVATDSDDASNGSDEVDLEAEGEEAALLTNGPAYYDMFLDLEEEECVKPKVKKRRGEHKLRQSHLGLKLNGTARTYNLVCNHRRRILSTTAGHPARWNDKTIVVKFDSFVMRLYNGDNLADVPFELYEYNERGEVTKREYRGAWLLTDNGYHKWSTTVPPYKSTTSRKEIRFSECIADADKIWKTCCALHNMLLEVDGLDEKWQDGVPSHWEGDGKAMVAIMMPLMYDLLLADSTIQAQPGIMIQVPWVLEMTGTHTFLRLIPYECCHTNNLQLILLGPLVTLEEFRNRLVVHFDIAFRKREVVCPIRNRRKQRLDNNY
ncbi:hypothetical protein IV203_021001 [Nitzschia inconspicua]|uniref:Uncharacterized protein n=1 Tax=Nitzschia inconspicua TaxID=303405 RepID=A0A9K3KGR9_9STRA|nr:hypothetical protein IV203_021001 [Nitzschia inconspicua]